MATILFNTAYSFIDLIKFLFSEIPKNTSFLSERISQDPLEKYFGRQRQRGGANENPTCQQFLQNNSSLRMVNSIRIETHKGNVRSTNSETDTVRISDEPLPKRKIQISSTITDEKTQQDQNILSASTTQILYSKSMK